MRSAKRVLHLIKPWHFLVVAIIFGIISVISLRANNEHMVVLRNAVYAADKNNTNVQLALKNLQSYVTGHMNTELDSGPNAVYPPIQLKYTYDRLVQAQSDAVAKTNLANSQFYTTAQLYCEQQDPTDFYGQARIPCIEQYLTTHNEQAPPTVKPPADALYKFDFISPSWSPDTAGFSLLATVVFGITFIVSFIVKLVSKRRRQ